MLTRRSDQQRSGCAINAAVEVIGDRWSPLVLRDVMFGNRRHFRVLQERSEEAIASNILAQRPPAAGRRRLVLAMVAAWRWDIRDEFPDRHQHGRDILSLLRQGPPWPALGTPAGESRNALTSA